MSDRSERDEKPEAAHQRPPIARAFEEHSEKAQVTSTDLKDAIPVSLRVNGKKYDLRIDPRTTLLDCLREHIHLTGSKKGCDHGQCGACTVHINGRRRHSCLAFAALHEGDEITTIEGIGQPEKLHPMQAAFVEMRCLSVRLLHFRPDHVGGGALERTVRTGRCRREGIHERQYLPLRRVSEHRRRDSAECGKALSAGEHGMKTFQLTRAETARKRSRRRRSRRPRNKAQTFDFIAGGTTLIDLMKLNVETPADVDRHQSPAVGQDRSDFPTAA